MNHPADPDCKLCSGSGELTPAQSPNLQSPVKCICVVSAEQATQREIELQTRNTEQQQFKELIKTAVREVFAEVAGEDPNTQEGPTK